MRKLYTIIPVRPERSGAKSKDALFVLATVLMVAALAGCGGSGSKMAALPMPTPIALPQGIVLEPGAILTIPAGTKRTVGQADGIRAVASCPQGGEDCVITAGADGAAQYTGGMPTVDTVPYTTIQLPEGDLMLPEDPITILAGTSYILRQTFDARTELKCPDDGPDCVVSLAENGAAESTGGAPTVVTYTTLYLPIGHTLTEGPILAGESRPLGGYSKGSSNVLVCPADGPDCEIVLGEYDFESTGGAPYVDTTVTNQMVWQANNGPDGTSDGAHARGLEGRLIRGSNLNVTNPLLGSGGSQRAQRQTAVVNNTRNMGSDPMRTVTPTASWASSDAAPTLGLTVSNTGANTFSVDDDSDLPSLGTGWNGAVLHKTVPTGNTGHAILYSDITKQPAGGSADTFYMTLGVWLVMPDDPAAASTLYDLGAFAHGSSGLLSSVTGSIHPITGMATFRGPAAGLYSAATYSDSGGSRALETAEVGSFTATATINANFGGAGSFSGVSGTVTDFMENGESLGNWRVNLDTTSNSTAGSPALFIGQISGGQAGSRSLGTGNWGVEFYRSGASGHPDFAVGIFTASTLGPAEDALHIVGAFGAERQ